MTLGSNSFIGHGLKLDAIQFWSKIEEIRAMIKSFQYFTIL
jgi:hypothetical protein